MNKTHLAAFVFISALLALIILPGCPPSTSDDPQDQEAKDGFRLVADDPSANQLFDAGIKLDRNIILKGEDRPAYLLLTFDVPDQPEEEMADRPVMNLALVLDRSGSMEDRGKMEYAKQAAKTIVDMMEPHDTLAIVEYDDEINVLWPATPVESPEMIKSQIDTLFARGSTNLTGGMLKGIEEVMGVMHNEAINRVILMSDGLANQGITDPREIARLVREARDKGVSVSDIGLGLDYNEDLMMQIAENGGGNYYYVENPSVMERIFRQEMSTIYSTVAKELMVSFEKSPAVTGVEIFGYQVEDKEGSFEVPMGSLYAGESRSLVIRLTVDAAKNGKLELGSLKVRYTDVENNQEVTQSADLNVLVSSDEEKAAQAVNTEVQAETTLVEVDQRHEELIRQFESGDVAGAQAGINKLKEELAEKNVKLDDLAVEKKLEALEMEGDQMAVAEDDAEARKQYLKANKQRLYQSQKGKRQGYILKLGDKGIEVEELQKALKQEGFYSGAIDGVFSKELENALIEFQKQNSLTADGVAGPGTLSALQLY